MELASIPENAFPTFFADEIEARGGSSDDRRRALGKARSWLQPYFHRDFHYPRKQNINLIGEFFAPRLGITFIPPPLFHREFSLGEFVKAIDIFRQEPSDTTNAHALRGAVPRGVPSPIDFIISNGRLVVAKQRSAVDAEDEANVAASKSALLARGEKIVEELRRSNCDRRLLDSVVELQSGLASDGNLVQLGLINIFCEEMCAAFGTELSDALRGMLLGHTRGVSMYVAQFADWQRFSEKAAAAELAAADIARISSAARRMIADLEAHPDIAEPEVPKIVRALQHLIADPKLATKRAAFALLRTMENLIAKVFQYGADFIETLAVRTSDRASTAGSKLIVAALMSLAVTGAVEMSPLGAKIADSAWLKPAAEMAQKLVEELAP